MQLAVGQTFSIAGKLQHGHAPPRAPEKSFSLASGEGFCLPLLSDDEA